MASRKEYEMLFQLNAQMGSSYSSTFSKAQQQVASMQKEIQALSKTQSGIAAFQKQQTAVENTRQKMALLQQQYDNIQKEMKETEGYSSSLENKLLQKQQQIERTSDSLDKQTAKLREMEGALQSAGVDTQNLTGESAKLADKISELKTEQEKVATGAEDFGEKSSTAFSTVADAIAAAGIAVALKKIYDGYMECISIAGDFEEEMSNVEAISGASAQEMAALSEKAKELGASTKFTAKESAQAMGYMAMAGWKATDMLSGMDGVLQLAAASGEDLAKVSDIVTDSLTAFGLGAADTARFSDILAATSANANTNVGMMGETFKYAAPLAGALGYSVEDVATMIGLMANAGIKGSQSGTALRNMFTKLTDGATLTGKAFGEVKIETQNADGTMRALSDVVSDLRVRFSEMSEAEQIANAKALVGDRAMSGFITLMKTADGDFQKLQSSIVNCTGAAERMANVKLQNMNGQITIMQSAWDGLKIAVGELYQDSLQKLYAKLADILSAVTKFIQANPTLIKFITSVVIGLGSMVGVLLSVKAAMTAVKLATAAWTAVLNMNHIVLAATAIIGVTAAIVAYTASVDDAIPSVKELTEEAREMEEVMKSASDGYREATETTQATALVAGHYIDRLDELKAANMESTEAGSEYQNTLAILLQTMPELSDCISVTTDEYGRNIYTLNQSTDALRVNTEEWKRNAIAQAYQEGYTEMVKQYSDVLVEQQKNEIGLSKAQQDRQAVEQRQQAILQRMDELQREASAKANEMAREYGLAADMVSYLTQEYYDLENELPNVNEELFDAQRTEENYKKAINDGTKAAEKAQAEIDLYAEAIKNLTDVEEDNSDAAEEQAEDYTAVTEKITSAHEALKKLEDAYNEAYDAALKSVQGQYDLWDKADTVVATSAQSITSNLAGQATYWENYNANLASLGERTGEIEGLREMLASFADGSKDSVNAVAGMAKASDEDLAKMVENWQKVQEAQKEVSGSLADLKTDFDTQFEAIKTGLQDDLAAMNMSAEARSAANQTLQGYLDGMNDMMPKIKGAYDTLSLYARIGAYGYSSRGSLPGYAGGTRNAARGFAMVGEEGPELMYFNGGEGVLDAKETAALQSRLMAENAEIITVAPQLIQALGAIHGTPAVSTEPSTGGGNNVNLEISFHIDGNADYDTVEQLRDYGDEFADRVLEVLEEAGIDTARRAYS